MRDSDPGHLDEGTVHAWLDGALAPADAARVAAHVEACGACAAMVAEARGLIAGSSRILSMLDDVPAGVVPRERAADDAMGTDRVHVSAGGAAPRPTPAASRRWLRDPRTAVAAAALIAAAGLASTRLIGRDTVDVRSMTAGSDVVERAPAVAAAAAPALDSSAAKSASTASTADAARTESVQAVMEPPAPAPASASVAAAGAVPDVAPVAAAATAPLAPRRELMVRPDAGSLPAPTARVSIVPRSPATRVADDMADASARLRTSGSAANAMVAAAPASPPAAAAVTIETRAAKVDDVLSLQQGFTAPVTAPGVALRGRVVDRQSAQPIEGVQVRVAGTGYGAMTDADGRFTLRGVSGVAADSLRLQLRRIGYAATDSVVVAAPASTLAFALVPATTALMTQTITRSDAAGNATAGSARASTTISPDALRALAVPPAECYDVRAGAGAPRGLPAQVSLPGDTSRVLALQQRIAPDSVVVRVGSIDFRLERRGLGLHGTAGDSAGVRGPVELRPASCRTK